MDYITIFPNFTNISVYMNSRTDDSPSMMFFGLKYSVYVQIGAGLKYTTSIKPAYRHSFMVLYESGMAKTKLTYSNLETYSFLSYSYNSFQSLF